MASLAPVGLLFAYLLPLVGQWLSEGWASLNEPVAQPSTMSSLTSGLVSALISAGVALLVAFFTVRAQNRGIQKQLETQRHENTRVRDHEIASRCLTAVRGFAATAALDKHYVKQVPAPLELTGTMSRTLEELRLNLDSDDDGVIDAFQGIVSGLQFAYMESFNGSSQVLRDAFGYLGPIEAFLKIHITKYVRATVPERIAMTSFLTQASGDLYKMNFVEWDKTYN
jgi:hypothetical protein